MSSRFEQLFGVWARMVGAVAARMARVGRMVMLERRLVFCEPVLTCGIAIRRSWNRKVRR
jgi:hypothetical protein